MEADEEGWEPGLVASVFNPALEEETPERREIKQPSAVSRPLLRNLALS